MGVKIHIPLPLQVVIDDVGWWSGEDGHERQEPYRTGIGRNHVPTDYQAIASLGRQLNMRPQSAFVTCEWDRKNILRRVPASTWMGEKWENCLWPVAWMEEAAEIVRSNSAHLELAMHTNGHEYWEGGTFTRSEWHDSAGEMRPPEIVHKHLDAFAEIFLASDLGPLPESYVPPAFNHAFGAGPTGFTAMLKARGIRYISTYWGTLKMLRPVETEFFGVDEGIMTLTRGEDIALWKQADCFPPEREASGPILGMHWPNVLHPDPERNEEVVARWVHYLKPYDAMPHRMLARNTQGAWTQLAYHAWTQTRWLEPSCRLQLDFSKLDGHSLVGLASTFTLKVETDRPLEIHSKELSVLKSDFHTALRQQVLTVARQRPLSRTEIQFTAGS